jgi:Family of unknown function (DUF6152)
MKHRFGCLFALAFSVVAVATLAAHHEILAKFDDKKPVTLRGIVTRVDWLNPHVHVFINVKDAATTVNWAIELESAVDLQRGGLNRDSLKPGDAITVQGIAARNGGRQAWARSVVMTAGGKRVLEAVTSPSA